MARQYAIPGGWDGEGGYINAAQDGREYAIPSAGYFNDETSVAGGLSGTLLYGGKLLNGGILVKGSLLTR